MQEHEVPDWYIESCHKRSNICSRWPAVAYLMSAIRLMWFKLYHPQAFCAVYFTVRGDDIDYEAAVGGAAVARAHMDEVKRRLKKRTPGRSSRSTGQRMLVRAMRSCPSSWARAAATE